MNYFIEMNTVRTLKAQPVTKDSPVKSTTIEIWTPTPDYEGLRDQYIAFLSEAARIEDALYNSLPGGIYDKLLSKMLERKASHFNVAFGDHDNG